MADAPLEVPGNAPGARVVADGPREATLTSTWGASRWDKFLSRGDWAVGGLALGVGALLLRRLLDVLAAGRLAEAATLLRGLALLVAAGGLLAPLGPQTAARSTLARMGLEEGQPFAPGAPGSWWPLVVAAGLLVAAQALRRGGRPRG